MSNRPEFAAVYGRRRIGKTFLIREFFEYKFDFYATGTANSSINNQLKNFYKAILKYRKADMPMKAPEDWFDAFALLEQLLESLGKKEKLIVFLDELP